MKIGKMHFTQSEKKSVPENLDVAKLKIPDVLVNSPLKKLSNSLRKPKSLVFNTIAKKQAYRIAWKTSQNLPFFKHGDKQNVANYPFISLLSCTTKLLLCLIFVKVYDVIEHLFAPEQ